MFLGPYVDCRILKVVDIVISHLQEGGDVDYTSNVQGFENGIPWIQGIRFQESFCSIDELLLVERRFAYLGRCRRLGVLRHGGLHKNVLNVVRHNCVEDLRLDNLINGSPNVQNPWNGH
jgi:hypothetical protein